MGTSFGDLDNLRDDKSGYAKNLFLIDAKLTELMSDVTLDRTERLFRMYELTYLKHARLWENAKPRYVDWFKQAKNYIEHPNRYLRDSRYHESYYNFLMEWNSELSLMEKMSGLHLDEKVKARMLNPDQLARLKKQGYEFKTDLERDDDD